MRKEYLGDAVYIDVDRYGRFILTTENGLTHTNVIVLEPETVTAMLEYIQQARVDRYGRFILTTENGLTHTNVIVLEPETVTAVLEYIQQARKEPQP